MRRFAELDTENIVLRVIVADSAEWCEENLGGRWLETFKESDQRGRYAARGFTYDEANDRFLPPQPFPSWSLNEETLAWEPPVPRRTFSDPETGEQVPGPPLRWDEESLDWVRMYPGMPDDGQSYVWDESVGEWVVSE